uniref:SCP domain-containing protein n=1 Tax=Strongyloides stercoralis TaxID=6248 RepID=A0A0K0EEW9_STRER
MTSLLLFFLIFFIPFSDGYHAGYLPYRRPGIPIRDVKLIRALKPSVYSSLVWEKIWSRCSYACYSINNFSRLRQKLLTELNTYRRHNQSPSLILDNNLSKKAQKRAQKLSSHCRFLRMFRFKNRGEIVGITKPTEASKIVRNIYIKGDSYNYSARINRNKFFTDFIQLIWKSSRTIGIGIVSKKDRIYIVFLFNPAGNRGFGYNKNVLPPK